MLKFRVFWDVAMMIVLIMEAVHTSESWVHFNMTIERYIPEDSKLHTRRRENLKCQNMLKLVNLFPL
jgi:hypothetical protein